MRARTIVAARSSGRMSFMAPLNARPMGERAVATMTASSIMIPLQRVCRFSRGGEASKGGRNRLDGGPKLFEDADGSLGGGGRGFFCGFHPFGGVIEGDE